MTKTESANRTVQAVVIEACEQLLECQMSAGARLAIPNTGNLIMVGPPEWIAKNVPGVEAMVEASEPKLDEDDITAIWQTMPGGPAGWLKSFGFLQFARAIEAEVIDRLAATTQASTAQAERVPEGWKLVPVEPTPEIIAGAAIAAWPTASAADIALAQKAARIVLMQMDSAPGITADMLAATLATMAPAYRAMLDVAPAAPIAATSSTDAQAAAEVRDAAQDWAEGKRIANVPIVGDALRGFSEDPTSDNGVCVVLAVLDSLKRAGDTEGDA